jgi:hypothetical protein
MNKGIVTGLRLAADLLVARVNSASRVVGTSRLYGDAVRLRIVADLIEAGDIEEAQGAIKERWGICPDIDWQSMGNPARPGGAKQHSAALWLTTSEAAELTGESESTWRNRCARHDVPGAIKKGKQWLIPAAAVLLLNVVEIETVHTATYLDDDYCRWPGCGYAIRHPASYSVITAPEYVTDGGPFCSERCAREWALDKIAALLDGKEA